MSGDVWRDFLACLDTAAGAVTNPEVAPTPQLRAEGYRHVLRLLRALNLLILEYADPERPILNRQFDLGTAFALDNPDTLYHAFPVRADGVYLLSAAAPARPGSTAGVRRLVRRFDPALLDCTRVLTACGAERRTSYKPPHFVSLNNLYPDREGGLPHPGATINNAVGSLAIRKDGSFEVLISAKKQRGNWLRLETDAPVQQVFVRQTFGDWENENPVDLRVVRLDKRGTAPALTPEAVAAALTKMGFATIFQANRWLQNARDTLAANGLNVVETPRFRPDLAGLPGQYYAQGAFEVAADQALVIEFQPPTPCFYWGLQLTSHLGESLDYANRIVSINGAQAHVDRDGWVRAVLAHSDPGVPNWLDLGGVPAPRRGLAILRFTECGSEPTFAAPKSRLLPLADVRSALPADHPAVTGPERQHELDLRREHLARRLGQ